MSYLRNIELAFFLLPLLIFFSFLPIIIYQYIKYWYANGKRIITFYLFGLFLIIAYFMIILPLPEITANFCEIRAGKLDPNFEAFRFIREIVEEISGKIWLMSVLKTKTFMVTAFNFLLLLPLGIFLRYLYKFNWWQTLLTAFGVSLFFEISQLTWLFWAYPCAYRLFELDDLMTNTSWAMLGFFIFWYLKFLPKIDSKKITKHTKKSSLTQKFLVHSIDYLLFIFLSVLLPLEGNMLILTLFFILYFVLIPKTRFWTTIAGKIFSLKLLKKWEKQTSYLDNFIFYWIIFLFPVLAGQISGYYVENTYNNWIYALVWMLSMILWFILVIILPIFNKKRRWIQWILSDSDIIYIKK